jgi:predicted regulator of Ras-like GTPase activity (Roadblock/LC7/MglB family)
MLKYETCASFTCIVDSTSPAGGQRGDPIMDPQLTSLLIGEEDVKHVDSSLERLVLDTGANYAMLLDKSGQVIAARGDTQRQDITALGALLAGTFASSREVARLLKEKDFRVLFQQGVKENIFTELIDEQWMLVVMFDKRTHIGLVKVLAKRATEELSHVLQQVRSQSRSREAVISTSFRTSVEDTIDLLFRD